MNESLLTRRSLCSAALAAAAAAPLVIGGRARAQSQERRIFYAVKSSMLPRNLSLMDQFRVAHDAGYDGVSLLGHLYDLQEVHAAQDATGLPVHNVNVHNHWNQRLTDPDPKVRQESLENLEAGIRFSHAVGGSSVLSVIGKVTDPENENHDQVWKRSIEQIKKALPLASRLGVRILCENVGNGFCETPQQWAAYLDEINSPWVGAFYDIGNHHSRGGADVWARVLGRRIVKLDVKGHSTETKRNCDIFEGDIDWAAVRKELAALRFTGWATAEVKGGDLARHREVVANMKKALEG